MRLGSFHSVIVLIALFAFAACNGDDGGVMNGNFNSVGSCDILIDEFNLNGENKAVQAYDEYTSVTFINENGDRIEFNVGNPVTRISEGIFEDPDSTLFCFSNESIETILSSTAGLEFTVLLEAKAYFADLTANQSADVLKVFYNDVNDEMNARRIVFRKVLDIKNYPTTLYETTQVVASRTFIDREFKNVEFTNFNTPIIIVYYNDELGIIAFVDEEGVLWEFEAKI